MKQVTTIKADKSAKWLTDVITELPKGIFRKGQTGVGGTTLAIDEKSGKYIISVPSKTMITQKCHKHSNLFGVYAGVKEEDFYNFVENGGNKIMVTYDSTAKVVGWLANLGINVFEEWKILVDEYHQLLTEYSYRNKAIANLLEVSVKFSYATYMSATPIEADFCPSVLEDLDEAVIDWSSTRVKPIRRKTTKPYAYAANIIRAYKAGRVVLNGHKSEEAYFFVNSVKAIKNLIDNTGLLPSEVKIICSDNASNREVLGNYEINKVEDANKPFTFITSLGFLGCDFESESGIIYIVSSVGNKNTLLDIATSINQIVGRIRTITNPFKNIFYHIYNTGASDMTPEEFKEYIDKGKEESQLIIDDLNTRELDTRMIYAKRLNDKLEDSFFMFDEASKTFKIDELKIRNAEWEYRIVNETYTNGASIRESYLKAGFDVTIAQQWCNSTEDFIESATKTNWNQQLEGYIKARENKDDETAAEWLAYDPQFKTIYETLGAKKCNTLDYSKTQITQAMFECSTLVVDSVKQRLVKTLKAGEFYSCEYLKDLIAGIYEEFKIKKSAKASLMEEYFGAKVTVKKKDGKAVKGYAMVSVKRK